MQSKKGSIAWDCATKIIEDDTYMLNFKHSYDSDYKKMQVYNNQYKPCWNDQNSKETNL